uniref:G-protein coupled receptors family 1 profile domain-containing protein n=1 Tax=Chrysemys picta bellii TaxID=8478 RepID=A0A8C3HRB4_CHRPI
MPMENQTKVTEFILLGLSSDPQVQIFLFLVFLVIYVVTLVGNILIMLVIRADSHLHTPMYLFLFHLSFVDICYSSITFLLLGFSDVQELQILHFVVFLVLYLAALVGNLPMITAVAFDHHLHTPMYFFLMNLSILDIGSISVPVTKSLSNSLMNTRSISYSRCVAQLPCLQRSLTPH